MSYSWYGFDGEALGPLVLLLQITALPALLALGALPAFLLAPARAAPALFVAVALMLLLLIAGPLWTGAILLTICGTYGYTEFVAQRTHDRGAWFWFGLLAAHAAFLSSFRLPLPPLAAEAVARGFLRAPDAMPLLLLFGGGVLTFLRMLAYYHDRIWRARPRVPFRAFLAYALFPTQFWHGPLERAADAAPRIASARQGWMPADLIWGLGRCAWGLFLLWLLWRAAENARYYFGDAPRPNFLEHPAAYPAWQFLLILHLIPFGLYWIESMWAHLALGASRCFGFEGTEGYRYPFHAATPAELWRRWNMTFSRWLRDYAYIPLGGSRWCKPLATFLTFGYCGILHGPQLRFLAWGVFAGASMALFGWVGDRWVAQRATTPPHRGAGSIIVRGVGRVLTYHWMALGALIVVDPENCGTRVLHHYFYLLTRAWWE